MTISPIIRTLTSTARDIKSGEVPSVGQAKGDENLPGQSVASKTVQSYTYDQSGRVVGTTAQRYDASSPNKTTTITETQTYNSLGQVAKETTEEHKTGTSTDVDAIKEFLKNSDDEVVGYTFVSGGKTTVVKDIEYNDDGNIASYTTVDEEGAETFYKDLAYDDDGKLKTYTVVSDGQETHVKVAKDDDVGGWPVRDSDAAYRFMDNSVEDAAKPTASIDLKA